MGKIRQPLHGGSDALCNHRAITPIACSHRSQQGVTHSTDHGGSAWPDHDFQFIQS